MKQLVMFLISGVLFACNSQTAHENKTTEVNLTEEIAVADPSAIDTSTLGLKLSPSETYNATKQSIAAKRKTANSKEDFENYLLNEIIPHWYGTQWDFNGVTAIPNKGKIACGYFVSTTLLHVGVQINRYKMAQQAGLHEAQTVALGEDKYFKVLGIEALKEKMTSEYEDGLYFVGLDNHVGYLYMKDKELYFIHSSYEIDAVTVEKAEYSYPFKSNVYVVAELSTNEKFLEKWRKGETFTVIRPN